MQAYSPDYIRDALVRFTYHSNAIEGNSLSLGQTEAIVLYDRVTFVNNKGVKLRDIYEASNQKDAFYLMLNMANNNAELTIDNILKLQ